MYSRADPVNHINRLGDDYVLVHNLKATGPLPFGLVGRGREYSTSEPTILSP
jgi:hypothetical protein